MKYLRSIFLILFLTIVTSGCAQENYFIPPSAPPEKPLTMVVLNESTLPDLINAAEPASINPDAQRPDPETSAAGVVDENTDLENSETNPDGESSAELGEADVVITGTETTEVSLVSSAPFLYYAKAADTLPVVAVRFGVDPSEISSREPIPDTAYLTPGQLLVIPRRLTETTTPEHTMPDSEVVYSPSAANFDVDAFVTEAGGKLSRYKQWLRSTGTVSGADVVNRVAIENSINPRLLLSLLEYQSGWVYGDTQDVESDDYPMGYIDVREKGLYNQLVWAVNQLSIGYYAYREGRMTEIHYPDGVSMRLAPELNAGSAALQYYFAQHYQGEKWEQAVDADSGFPALHTRMFGDTWARAAMVEPLFPRGLAQPSLILPFMRGWPWAHTGGAHGAWERDGAFAALDFAPGSTQAGCFPSPAWVTASASGLVVRSGNGIVAVDLDGDGYEQTGWVLVYLHIEKKDRIPVDTWVDQGQEIGHPSCEGGISTGTHVHIARKFNGEWIPADGPLPFNLGGWVAHAGDAAYKGTLTRDGEIVTACTCANAASFLTRGDDDP
jgi:LysM repeat protein